MWSMMLSAGLWKFISLNICNYLKICTLNILDVFFFGEKEVLSKAIERILINTFE